MSLKKQAEDLLILSSEIEKQAAEVTSFVCDKCKHTTTLAKINTARKQAANEVSENVVVSDITVNDKVTCPAPDCQGVLSYQETEDSKAYYYDPDKVATDDAPQGDDDKSEEKAPQDDEEKDPQGEKKASINYDAIDRYIKG